MKNFTSREFILKFEFADSLALSLGKQPDIARATIINPILFSSKKSGNIIKNGTVIEIEIPKQYPSEIEYDIMTKLCLPMQIATCMAGLILLITSI